MIFGIDYGVRSPSLCIKKKNSFDFYFFSSRKKHIGFEFKTKDKNENIFSFHTLKYPVYNSREERYDSVANLFIEIIKKETKNFNVKDINIFIEGYAFSAQGRGVSLLFETGGILRGKFFQNGWTYTEVNPSSLKKSATGKGNSNKNSMYQFFKLETDIDLFGVFDIREGDQIPSPIQDIVDSYYLTIHEERQKNTTLNKGNKEQRLSKKSKLVGNLLKRLQEN
jgi:Holliday junction resolvasome RuvABC endonuclease subunit